MKYEPSAYQHAFPPPEARFKGVCQVRTPSFAHVPPGCPDDCEGKQHDNKQQQERSVLCAVVATETLVRWCIKVQILLANLPANKDQDYEVASEPGFLQPTSLSETSHTVEYAKSVISQSVSRNICRFAGFEFAALLSASSLT